MPESNASVIIVGYERYDPLMVKVKVTEGTLERGDYIPEAGQIDDIYDGDEMITTAETRDEPYFDLLNARHKKLQYMIQVLGARMKWNENNPGKSLDDFILDRMGPSGEFRKDAGITLNKEEAQENARKRVKRLVKAIPQA
ncbi:hypothetical protein HK097_009901 [Rhizophlyctis rosea]|uniref:Uncharacterized protein n=1 Tax=Rhizophlyctis rosea TaxID=64517 RepID=A0AAD5X2W5_9FUNG|nr:hypothetical protein HK097_009901 [Rhizophlyctis rosea]